MGLEPRWVVGSLDLTSDPYSVDLGVDYGNPQNIYSAIASLLLDGEIESFIGRPNRSIVLPLTIQDADLAAVAAAEAALIEECDRQQNTLTVDPGDGYGAVTVFDTFAAQLERVYDDFLEMVYIREYRLTIPALPNGRSADLVVDDAGTPPSSGGVVLEDCESTSGWAAWGGWPGGVGTFAVDGSIYTEGAGSLRSQAHFSQVFNYPSYSTATNADQVTGLTLDTDTGGYLSLAVKTEWSDNASVFGGSTSRLSELYMQVDGGAWDAVPTFVAASYDEDGFTHYVWPVDAGLNVTGLRMVVLQFRLGATFPDEPFVWYDDIELLPAATTDHQIVKQLTIQGSARTPASLRVAAPSESVTLDEVLIATVPTSEIPAGFQPDGARWVTQGDTTSDVTAIAGIYYTPDTSYSDATGTPDRPIFNIPVSMLTAGPYTMIGLVKAESSSLNFGVQAQLDVDGTLVGPTSEAEVSPTGLATGWQFVTVGTVYLPPLPVQNADSTTTVRLIFKGAKMADVYFIPAWQIGGAPVADFSIVSCGDGTVEPGGASSSLWIDSPSTTQPQGGWWRGPTDDRLNAQSAWPDAKNPGVHTFAPGGLTAFVVSTGAAGPTLTLSYFPAWVGMAVI